jgi:hypothetical protein
MRWLFFYRFFFFSSCWKNQTQIFSLLLWNYLQILKILLVTHLTHFKKPKAAILTLQMLTGSHLAGKLILAQFPCNHWVVRTREHASTNHREENFEKFSKHFKISKKFQRSKEKVNNCLRKWKASD